MNFDDSPLRSSRPILMLLLALTLAGCGPQAPAPAASGPQSWIDAPLPDTSHPLDPVEIIAHANDPDGVDSYEFAVNGQVLATDRLEPDQAGESLAFISRIWDPPAPGTYQLSIRAAGEDGAYGDSAEVRIQIGNLPPTSTSTPATINPPGTGATSTPTPSFILNGPRFSSQIFYFEGDSCGPKELTIQAEAGDPQIWSVVLFFRLADPASADRMPWVSVAMNPSGSGMFSKTLHSQVDIPGFATYIHSILQVQLVATDAQGSEIARTAVFSSVQLEPCN